MHTTNVALAIGHVFRLIDGGSEARVSPFHLNVAFFHQICRVTLFFLECRT